MVVVSDIIVVDGVAVSFLVVDTADVKELNDVEGLVFVDVAEEDVFKDVVVGWVIDVNVGIGVVVLEVEYWSSVVDEGSGAAVDEDWVVAFVVISFWVVTSVDVGDVCDNEIWMLSESTSANRGRSPLDFAVAMAVFRSDCIVEDREGFLRWIAKSTTTLPFLKLIAYLIYLSWFENQLI